MTDEPMRDEEFDALLDELEDAGYVERYTNDDGQDAMRLTASGEQVARQLAMMAENDDAVMLTGLLGDGPKEQDAGKA